MATRLYWIVYWLALPILTGCSSSPDKNIVLPFKLEKDYFEIFQGDTITVFIKNGSGDISVKHTGNLDVEYSRNMEDAKKLGQLNITGSKPLVETITLVDNQTKEVQQLMVKVIPPYVCLEKSKSSDPYWKGPAGIFLIEDVKRSFYMCNYAFRKYRYVGPALCHGTYDIVIKDNRPIILLLQSNNSKFVREFSLSEKSDKAIEVLHKLSLSTLLPGDESCELPLRLHDEKIGSSVTVGLLYKKECLPEKILE